VLYNCCVVIGADVFIATDAVELTPANLAYYEAAVVGTYGAQPRSPQETRKLFKDAGTA
jgi:hypothetical protein